METRHLELKMENSKADIVLEVCVALAPIEEDSEWLRNMSSRIADSAKTLINLQGNHLRLSFAPHLTLYQLSMPLSHIDQACQLLNNLSRQNECVKINAQSFQCNAEGSVEISYKNTSILASLQKAVVDSLNVLRDGNLVEMDPAGKSLLEQLAVDPHGNIATTGWKEGIQDFLPHATLNWLPAHYIPDLQKSLSIPNDISNIFHRYENLCLYVLGPFGTCVQRLQQFPLLKAMAVCAESSRD